MSTPNSNDVITTGTNAKIELLGSITPNSLAFTTILGDPFNITISCDSQWTMIISINETGIPKLNLIITTDKAILPADSSWTDGSDNSNLEYVFTYPGYEVKINFIIDGGGIAMVGTISTRS